MMLGNSDACPAGTASRYVDPSNGVHVDGLLKGLHDSDKSSCNAQRYRGPIASRVGLRRGDRASVSLARIRRQPSHLAATSEL